MSSLIDPTTSSAATPMDDTDHRDIVHFDATVRRKEKMRQKASQEPQPAAAVQAAPSAATPRNGTPHAVTATAPQAATQPSPAPPTPVPAAAAPVPRPSVAASQPPSVPATPATGVVGPVKTKSGEVLSDAQLEKFVIDFVIEQTGYPEEMVELDADLEADLGIDSIKKAQLFGEIGEQLDVQVTISEDMSLDDFPTLRHVLDFLQGATAPTNGVAAAPAPVTPPPAAAVAPTTAAPAPTPAPIAPTPAAAVPQPRADLATPATGVVGPVKTKSGEVLSAAQLEKFVVDFVIEQTGYPEEMVELDADLEADLGIDSIKKAQLFGEIGEQLDVQVTISEDMSLDDFPTLRHVLEFLQGSTPSSNGAAVPATAPAATAPAPVTPVPAPAPISQPATTASYADYPAHGRNGRTEHSATATATAPSATATATGGVTGPVRTKAGDVLSQEQLEKFVVDFVIEQTGYPAEMVELDADLEADLGIDSIKKAQLFGEIGEQLDVQVTISEDMSLDDFPTLRHVLEFLQPGA